MTTKDYILIAEILNKQFNTEHNSATSLGIAIMDNLVDAFIADNARFDSDKFEDAVYKI